MYLVSAKSDTHCAVLEILLSAESATVYGNLHTHTICKSPYRRAGFFQINTLRIRVLSKNTGLISNDSLLPT